MNSVSLKEMNLTTLLPKYITDSLICYTLVHHKVDGGPDITTCNSNGLMYELKNKTVLRCLNLHEKATSVSCYYLTENSKLIIFYLVQTSSNRLLIIRRTDKYLKVVEAYDGIKEFQVFDFECLGYPQIKITFPDGFKDNIYKFPIAYNTEAELNESSDTMSESLSEELQILKKHIDDLSEEYNHLQKICESNDSSEDFRGIVVGSVMFSSSLDKVVSKKFMVCDKWHKIYGSSLVLGMKLHNVSNQSINDMEIIIKHKGIKDYSYCFFQTINDIDSFLFAPRKVCFCVKPDDKIYAVGAVKVPGFLVDSHLSISVYVTSSDLKVCFARENFELNILDVAAGSNAGLEERFTVEDLMSIMTVKSETRIKIETEDLEENSLESMLLEKLGFKRMKHLKDKLFYCTSTYLNEVFVALRHVSANPAVWIMNLYASDSSQIYFLINALYDLLPDNTTILCDEN